MDSVTLLKFSSEQRHSLQLPDVFCWRWLTVVSLSRNCFYLQESALPKDIPLLPGSDHIQSPLTMHKKAWPLGLNVGQLWRAISAKEVPVGCSLCYSCITVNFPSPPYKYCFSNRSWGFRDYYLGSLTSDLLKADCAIPLLKILCLQSTELTLKLVY